MGDPDRACAAIRGPWAGTEAHRDAPFWSTPTPVVERMLDLAGVGPGDRLIDLGCGDGRIVIAAARRGASALGIDIDRTRITDAQDAAQSAGVEHLANFRLGDLFAETFEGASVVTLYLLPLPNRLLGDRLRSELAAGSRVVSHGFSISGWEATLHEKFDGRDLYLWTVI